MQLTLDGIRKRVGAEIWLHDATLSLDCNSWDCLSGLILVEEAGGLATRYTDGHTLLDRRAIAACTPGIAGHIRDAADIGDIL